jgi:hypothetical protein
MNPFSPVKYDVNHSFSVSSRQATTTTPVSLSPSGSVSCQQTLSNLHPFNPSAASSARHVAVGGVTLSPSGGMSRASHGSSTIGDIPQYQLMSPTATSTSSSPSYTDRHLLFGPVGRKMARNAYNMVGFLVEELKMHSLVLTTSMMYYQAVSLQIGVSGVHEINEIVLACACVLLASKVEHSRVKMSKLVVACFAIDPPDASVGDAPNQPQSVYAQYKRMVLEAEMIVCSLLDFEFHRQSPNPRIAKTLGITDPTSSSTPPPPPLLDASSSNASNSNGYLGLYAQCKKLYSTLLVSPIIEYDSITSDVLADAIVIIAAKYLQCEEDEMLQSRLSSAPSKLVEIVERELLEVLAQQSARTQIEMLNTRVKQLRAARAAKTSGGKRSRSTER